MKIGVYVGSFDPVHNGHLEIINEILKEVLVDELLVVATSDYWNKHINLSLEQRVELLEIFKSDKIRILTDNIKGELRQYTYQLLKAIQEEYLKEEDTIYLVLGADNIVKFDEWKEYQYLLDNYPFILVNRNNIDIDGYMRKYGKEDYMILKLAPMDISSTYIRENIADYDKIKDMIDIRVYEKIRGFGF